MGKLLTCPRLTTRSGDGSVWLWRSTDGTLLQRFQKDRGVVTNVIWSPDGTRLANYSGNRGNGELFVWDVRNEAQCGELFYPLNEPITSHFSPLHMVSRSTG